MTDARLGIDIDSAPLAAGIAKLDAIVPAAQRAERATGKMADAIGGDFKRIAATSQDVQKRIDAMFSGSSGGGQRAKDVQAYGEELDKLRARFNPLFAASQAYEKELKDVAAAERLGAISAKEAATAREAATQSYRSAAAAASGFADTSGGMGQAIRGLAPQIQNTSYQIQDFAVQVASGTAASTALAQQLPQLAGGFGVWGAAAGAALAIGIPLVAMLVNSGSAAKSLEDQVEDLADAYDALKDAQDEASKSVADLREDYGQFAEQAQVVIDRLLEIEKIKSLAELEGVAKRVSEQFGTLNDTMSRVDLDRGITPFIRIAERAGEALDMSTEEAREFAKILVDLGNAEGAGAVAAEMERAQQAIRDSVPEGQKLEGVAADLYEQLNSAQEEGLKIAASLDGSAEAAKNVSGAAEGISHSLDYATSSARALTAELQASVGAANSLAAATDAALKRSQIALQTAKINRQNAGNPIAAAGAIAAAEFNINSGDTSGLDPILRDALKAQRDKIVEQAKKTAENEINASLLNDPLPSVLPKDPVQRGSKGRGGGSSGAEKQADRLKEAYDRVTESLRYEIEQVGKSEVAQRAANEARRAGVDVTSAQGQAVVDLVMELERLKAEQERVEAVNQYVSDSFADLFTGAINGANDFKSALGGVLSQLSSMAISEGFQTITSGVGGTGFGGILSGLFGIGKNAKGNAFHQGNIIPFARGGIVDRPTLFPMARGTGLMGEAGPEAIIPLKRAANGALGIAGGGSNVTINYHISAPNADRAGLDAVRGELESIKRTMPSRIKSAIKDHRNRGAA